MLVCLGVVGFPHPHLTYPTFTTISLPTHTHTHTPPFSSLPPPGWTDGWTGTGTTGFAWLFLQFTLPPTHTHPCPTHTSCPLLPFTPCPAHLPTHPPLPPLPLHTHTTTHTLYYPLACLCSLWILPPPWQFDSCYCIYLVVVWFGWVCGLVVVVGWWLVICHIYPTLHILPCLLILTGCLVHFTFYTHTHYGRTVCLFGLGLWFVGWTLLLFVTPPHPHPTWAGCAVWWALLLPHHCHHTACLHTHTAFPLPHTHTCLHSLPAHCTLPACSSLLLKFTHYHTCSPSFHSIRLPVPCATACLHCHYVFICS